MTRTCDLCSNDLRTTESVQGRVSTGFGPGNVETFTFCSKACRARWRGDDVVLATTDQTRITAWDADGIDLDADVIAWGVA